MPAHLLGLSLNIIYYVCVGKLDAVDDGYLSSPNRHCHQTTQSQGEHQRQKGWMVVCVQRLITLWGWVRWNQGVDVEGGLLQRQPCRCHFTTHDDTVWGRCETTSRDVHILYLVSMFWSYNCWLTNLHPDVRLQYHCVVSQNNLLPNIWQRRSTQEQFRDLHFFSSETIWRMMPSSCARNIIILQQHTIY